MGVAISYLENIQKPNDILYFLFAENKRLVGSFRFLKIEELIDYLYSTNLALCYNLPRVFTSSIKKKKKQYYLSNDYIEVIARCTKV